MFKKASKNVKQFNTHIEMLYTFAKLMLQHALNLFLSKNVMAEPEKYHKLPKKLDSVSVVIAATILLQSLTSRGTQV